MYLKDYIAFWFTIGSRYFMIAGIAFLIFYVLLKDKQVYNKIQTRLPSGTDFLREILYSITTICIFAAVPLVILKLPAIARHTHFYTDIRLHGWVYFFIAFPIMFFIHDTYFYWTHRLMHHRKLFRAFHLVHHKSTNPSPWAAYAFHPLEALVEAGIFALFLFLMPIHLLHLAIFFFLMIVYNVYGHLGYELYPKGFAKSALGKWINTSVSHNQHHQYFKGNYGLYFTFWDRMMGTLRADYPQRFDEVTTRSKVVTALKHDS
jgi:Delta7-sterol 5-desaturase